MITAFLSLSHSLTCTLSVCLSLSTEHIETMLQLLTAAVKKFPLIVPEKSETLLSLLLIFKLKENFQTKQLRFNTCESVRFWAQVLFFHRSHFNFIYE